MKFDQLAWFLTKVILKHGIRISLKIKISWFEKHESTVNDVVIDSKQEYVASCGDDGKVTIFGLYDSVYDQVVEFNRPIKSVELEPNFSRTFSFVTGDTKVNKSLVFFQKFLFECLIFFIYCIACFKRKRLFVASSHHHITRRRRHHSQHKMVRWHDSMVKW